MSADIEANPYNYLPMNRLFLKKYLWILGDVAERLI